MNILIFKTQINSKAEIDKAEKLIERYSPIKNWSIDTEDIDNVLRVEAPLHIMEKDIIYLLRVGGLCCEVLE